MALIATLGGTDSNSYVTVVEAGLYFDNHVYASAWATVPNAEATLIYAATLLDTLVNFFGLKETLTQSMEWPRILPTTSDYDGIIPKQIKNAQCELALYLLSNDSVIDQESLSKLSLGPIKLDFNVDTIWQSLPPIVTAMVSGFGQIRSTNSGAVSNVALIRS